MKVENIYPTLDRNMLRGTTFRNIVKNLFILAAYVCPLVNLMVGGKAWSIVVLWALRFVWVFAFSRDLLEFTMISQTAKLMVYTCVTLALIDVFLSPGWAVFVIPIVCFSGLILIGIFFFSNINRQIQNIMPMVWVILASVIAIITSLTGWPKMSWPMVVLGVLAIAMLMLCVHLVGRDLLNELRKQFHIS